MINDKKLFSLAKVILTNIHNICLLGVLNTVFLNIANYLLHLELRNHSIQIVVLRILLLYGMLV